MVEREIITAKAIVNVLIAKVQVNRVMVYHVQDAKVLGCNKSKNITYIMNNPGFNIKKSLLKRQEAFIKFNTRKSEFLAVKEQIIKDIEEARIIYLATMSQLPKSEFEK